MRVGLGWVLMGAAACANGPSGTSDDTGEPVPLVDLVEVLPGTWTGVEESPTVGELTGTYTMSDEGDGRLDITLDGTSSPKLYVLAAAATETEAYATVPEQTYAEGQTGGFRLELVGVGTYGEAVDGGPFDAVYRLADDTFSLRGTVQASGEPEPFSFEFTR